MIKLEDPQKNLPKIKKKIFQCTFCDLVFLDKKKKTLKTRQLPEIYLIKIIPSKNF